MFKADLFGFPGPQGVFPGLTQFGKFDPAKESKNVPLPENSKYLRYSFSFSDFNQSAQLAYQHSESSS